MVVSTSATSNWLSSRFLGPEMDSRRLRCRASPVGRQVELRIAADQPVCLQAGEQLARRVGVQGPRAFEVGAQRLAGEPRPARGDQLQGVPGLGLGLALGEVPAQHGRQRPFGEGEGLAELAEDWRVVWA